jgi:peptide/nickel transport system substrate-binding protein
MNLSRLFYFLVFIILILQGCETEQKKSAVIVGIASDPESLNPLYSFSVYEVAVTEVLYPSLMQHQWDKDKGRMLTTPLLAESWEWAADSAYIRIKLRKDILWSDGKSMTADDVTFSFELFSDPLVQSRLYSYFKNFETDDGLKILPGAFDVEDQYTLRILFKPEAVPTINDLDVPVLPAHIYGGLKRDDIIYAEKDISPVTCGPYKLKSWNRGQSVILEKNSDSFLVDDNTPDEIIFRVIPDYNSRLTQLSSGEIDLMEDIRIDDVEKLTNRKHLAIDFVKGREYDYIGWNNIDPVKYAGNGKIVPNKFFGQPEIRRALTYSVNRQEMVNDYLLNYGEIAFSPVSPIFKDALNRDIIPLEYNPSAAREILKANNWEDRNRNGTIDKQGTEFSFVLNIPSGNPRREFAALVIRNNLKLVGIDARIEPLEPSVFFEKLFNKELNAWIAGWSVPIPPDLKPYWYSDLKSAPFNVMSFRNSEADLLLNSIDTEKNNDRRNVLLWQLQQVIYSDNPVTFLYWVDNIVAYNSRIKNVNISPLGAVHNLWEWKLNE